MKHFCFPIVAALMAITFYSCRNTSAVVSENIIQKRKYNRGFFISLNNIIKEKKSFQSAENIHNASRIQIFSQNSNLLSKAKPAKAIYFNLANNTETINNINFSAFASDTFPAEIRLNTNDIGFNKRQISALGKESFKDDPDKNKMLFSSVISFIAGIICVLGFAALFIFPPSEALVMFSFLTMVGGGLGGIYYGAKSLKKIKDNPGVFRGKTLATIGLWCGLGVCVISMLGLLIAMMASGGFN